MGPPVRGALAADSPFDPAAGYANWFWGLTSGALVALVATLEGLWRRRPSCVYSTRS